jgi:putative MATE family efflux protein
MAKGSVFSAETPTSLETLGGVKHPIARPDALHAMLEEPLARQILRLSLPNLTPFAAILVLVSIDAIVVGRLGREALAGLSLVFPLLMFSQSMAAGGVGSAVASTIARALSAGDVRHARSLALHGLFIALGISAISAGLMVSCGRILFVAMGARGDVLDSAVAYGTLTFLGAAAPWVLNVAASICRGAGNMRMPAVAMAVSAAIYVVVCPAITLGIGRFTGLGISGTAAAFVTSYTIGSLLILRSLSSKRASFQVRLREFLPKVSTFSEILKLAGLGAANATISNVTVLVATGFIGHLGPAALAGYGLGARLEYLVIPLSFAVGTALVTLVGANIGAHRIARAKRAAWIGALFGGAVTAVIGGFAALFPRVWLSVFTADAEIVRAGVTYLRIVGPFYGCFGLGLALYFAALGAGRPALAVGAGILRLAIVIVGLHVAANSLSQACIVIALGFLAYATTIFFGTKFSSWQQAI